MQVAIVDSASFYAALNEIYTLYYKTWYFSSDLCPFSRGIDVLVNSSTIYLLVCLNFHVTSLWNLHETQVKKNSKNPLTSNLRKDDSNECLVTKQENSNRLVTIDYRKRKDDVSVLFPTIFVWIASSSLSVPNFTLSSTLKLKENCTLCGIFDIYHGQIVQYLLLIFTIILPALLLCLTLLLLILKISKTTKSGLDNILTKRKTEIRNLLIFALIVSFCYIIFSFPRQILHCIHILSHSFNANEITNFKMPPFYVNFNNLNVTFLAMMHYIGGPTRALLCWGILANFSNLVKNKMCFCCKLKNK